MYAVLANFLILMFLSQNCRTQGKKKKKKELEETTFSGCLLNAQETNHQAFHKG